MASTDPKIATQGQWEDLAARVNEAVVVGDVISTPSAVAYVNTANIVDGAVTTAKIVNDAITADKVDFSTFGYKNGDVETIGAEVFNGAEPTIYGFNLGGLITNSSRNLCFSVILPKSLQNVSSVSVSNSRVWVRHVGGGYLLNNQALTDGGTVTVGIPGDNIVSITVSRSSAWSATNNTPIALCGAIQFTFN